MFTACPGTWRNFDELEEALTLAELDQILDAHRRNVWQQNKFIASLQQVELPDYDSFGEEEGQVTAEDIRRRAEAKIRGVSEEFVAFEEIGIMVIDDDEEVN